jgi:Kdo2-lipid IVA lauroyltransferase/acyltransferase
MNYIAIFILYLISLIPLRLIRLLGRLLGSKVIYYFGGNFKRKFIQNYSQALGYTPSKKDIVQAYATLTSLIFELPYIWLNNNARKYIHSNPQDFELIKELLKQNKGLIIIGHHWGSFELIPKHIVQQLKIFGMDDNFTTLYKKPLIKAVDNLVLYLRQKQKVKTALAEESGIRKIVKLLKTNNIICLLPDQVPQGKTGIWVPFFNKPAYTGVLLDRLQRINNTPIVICYMLQTKLGWEFKLEHLHDININNDTVTNITNMNKTLERIIALDYKQYLWGYNRYKTPQGALKPSAY